MIKRNRIGELWPISKPVNLIVEGGAGFINPYISIRINKA